MQFTKIQAADFERKYLAERDKICHELAAKVGPADSLPLCVERIRTFVLSDRVAFIFNVSVTNEDGRPALVGEAEEPQFVAVTIGVLRELGFSNVADHVEILPDLKNNPAPFAAVTKTSVEMWSGTNWPGYSARISRDEPGAGEPAAPDATPGRSAFLSGVPMDEALFGEPVYIYKELPDVYLIKNFSGYWGYVAKDGLRRISKKAFIRLVNAPKVLLLADFKSKDGPIPGGCRLPIEKWGAGRNCVLLGPSGDELEVPKKICLRNTREKETAEILAQARSLLGRPYKLAGRNGGDGVDCSGLVQFACRTLGINLARDAKQQYLNGNLILPCVQEALQPGDALFFMNAAGQVSHTGLYLGNGKFIHAVGKQVQIQSLDPAAPDYFERFARDFIGAKRYWW